MASEHNDAAQDYSTEPDMTSLVASAASEPEHRRRQLQAAERWGFGRGRQDWAKEKTAALDYLTAETTALMEGERRGLAVEPRWNIIR